MKFESLKVRDVALTLCSALFVTALMFMYYWYSDPQSSFLLMVGTLIAVASLLMRIIKKFGVVMILFGFTSLLTYNLGNLGIVGMDKFVSLVLSALILEAVFIAVYYRSNSSELSFFVSQGVAAACIPLLGSFIVSASLSIQNIGAVLNLVLSSGLSGLIGSALGVFAWHYLRTMKMVLRLMDSFKE